MYFILLITISPADHVVVIRLLYRDLPILEVSISGRILKKFNIIGNVKNVTVTIVATSITNTLFMITGKRLFQFVVFLLE
jgi:hypothetical protein